MWQTPAVDSFRSRSGARIDEMGLDQQARRWPTPKQSDANGVRMPDGKRCVGLNTVAGMWPTPSASLVNDGEDPENWQERQQRNLERHHNGNGMGMPLTMAAQMWATPRREDGESCGNHPGIKGGDSLTGQTKMWATPQERDTKSGETRQDYGNMRPLNEQAVMWHTPHGMGNLDQSGKRAGAGGGELALQANLWDSPTYSAESSPQVPAKRDGATCFCSTPGCALPSHKRKLNPLFVTWLMGWPIWWLTSVPMPFARPAMESYRFRLRWHLSYLLSGRAF
jgi:hypothetical protein